jgi:hypothetical protein
VWAPSKGEAAGATPPDLTVNGTASSKLPNLGKPIKNGKETPAGLAAITGFV